LGAELKGEEGSGGLGGNHMSGSPSERIRNVLAVRRRAGIIDSMRLASPMSFGIAGLDTKTSGMV